MRICFNLRSGLYSIWKQVSQGECEVMERVYVGFDSAEEAWQKMGEMLGINHPTVHMEGRRYGLVGKKPKFLLRRSNAVDNGRHVRNW